MNTVPWLMPMIKQINTKARNCLKNNLKRYEITDAQLEVLILLSKHKYKSINQRYIEQQLHLSNPTIVSLLDKLEEKKLVQRVISKDDRRQREIVITELGEKMHEALYDDFCRSDFYLTSGLTSDEVGELKRLLSIVLENTSAKKEDRND